MVTVRLAHSLTELDRYIDAWDRLAVSAARPTMRPAWLLSWWRGHCQSNDRSELRVALASDDRSLVGVLPLFVHDPEARIPVHELLGAGAFWGQGPVLSGDAPPEALSLLTEALAVSSPAPAVLSLAAVDVSHDWPQRVAAQWRPRGAWLYRRGRAVPCLTVSLHGAFDDWLRSARRPREHRRRLRRLAERGVTLRRSATASEFRSDLASLTRLHHARWANNSLWLSPTMEIALEMAGTQLIDSGGVRLWLLEGPQGVVGATLFASAGPESCCLLTAYDSAWHAFGPGIATIVAGIEDAFTRGEQVVDLGYGLFEYQKVMANSARPVAWYRLFPRGKTYPRARVQWAPRHATEHVQRLRVRLRARQRLAEVRNRLATGRATRRPGNERP